MAEDQDDSQKTEEPTDTKLRKARGEGNVPRSMEVQTWFILIGVAIFLATLAPGMGRSLTLDLRVFLEQAHAIPTDAGHLRRLLYEVAVEMILALGLPLLLMVVVAVAGSMLQVGWMITPKRLKPSFDKISPLKGAKRLFSLRSVIEFVKGLFKMAVVGAVAFAIVRPEFGRIDLLLGMDIVSVVEETHGLTVKVVMGVAAVVAAIAGADYLYQRFEFMKSMRMTKQEIKEEYKNQEGDPAVKGRLRQIRMQRARQRMMQAVPDATVVVTNPTHFAVALKYEMEGQSAPRVVAKGADLLAKRIREIAQESDVPIVENPPLARALYAAVDLDEEIPPEHYRAVAEIIGYVMRLKRRA